MMSETGFPRLPDQSSGSGRSFGTPRHPSIIDPILSKRVCFYKSGDPQFNGLRIVINNRTFKTFDALLDSLSKKVPLPFGVRNITTPRGVHAVYTLDELEDGKSYICSDSRNVKPINLALARKKPPPWYNARPVSSRRRTVQQAKFFPGKNKHKHEQVLMRTPKKLLVFHNGDPTVKHTVVLHKRTTPTFETILEYISELIQYQVVKLHTADGRRVDGLPGLTLCSGTVVAVGREPFRPANYNAQKSPATTTLPTKGMGPRRLRALKRKKKSLSYTSKSRNFSSSSERYIVNRIHHSIAGSSCDLPSHSVELESSRMLESVPETPEEQESFLPSEDDIEKSFRVNQDGSMTVEMKVRLTIKEEETIHWTTTLSRSAVANQLNETYLPEPEAEQEISSEKSNSLDSQSTAASTDTINKDKTHDNNDDYPPSLCNGAFSESGIEEDDAKVQRDMVSPRRAPTPGQKQIRKKQASVTSVTAEGIQEGMVGSYSYREQTENGAMTEQYCMIKQSSSRPVPKPRRLSSFDANQINSRNVSTFKSAGMSEILQIESSGEEVTETVLHLYEQQTYQDNFFANHCSQGLSASGVPFSRPATSETGQLYSNNEFEHQLWRPSTASESISILRAESQSVTSDLTLPSFGTGAIQATNAQRRFPKPAKGKDKPQQRAVNKEKRLPSKPKVINKRVRRLMTPGKRQKKNSTGATKKSKKAKTFSSARFIKNIYGNKSKTPKSMIKLENGSTQNGGGVTSYSSQSDDTNCLRPKDQTSTLKETSIETVEKSSLNVAPSEVSQPRGILTSMHREKKNGNKSYDVSKLPAFNSSSSVTNEYVENWLEKAHLNPTVYPEEESKKLEAVIQTENSRCGESENKNGLTVKCLEEKTQTCQTLKNDLLPENGLRGSVKQRIKSFENKSSCPSMEKTTQIICSEIIPSTNETSAGMPSVSELENKSSPIKISFQKATPSNILSMELPFPPPPAENTELSNNEYCVMDASSVASSPLYRLSSQSSQTSDNHPLSISPTSDKAISPTDHTMEMSTSIQPDIPSTQREAPLPRTPSIKRVPLVSNTSLDRKMSLRKACLDKYTLCSDATSETNTSSSPVNTVGNNVLPNCLTGTLRPSATPSELPNSKSSQSLSSPSSSRSEERSSSASISYCETPKPSDLPLEETEEAPRPSVKKRLSSPSPERKSQTKKFSSEPPLHNHNQDINMSPNIGRHATPNASPSTMRKLYKPKSQKRLSPYSQSLEMVSPPVRHKSSGRQLSRNLSSDSASEPMDKTLKKTSSQRKGQQTPQSITSTEMDITSDIHLEADQRDDNELTNGPITADQEKSTTQIMPQPINMANQRVLEKICYSIKSIRQITQNKHPSCLEKSNSLPDFSSHVASTFGSSSKALLAFLSIMTLKEGMTNPNMVELNANSVSCAESLKMIDSLREIASIEDSYELQASLSNLQRSASKQLLQSWKSFQELSNKCKSRSSTPNDSGQELVTEASQEKDKENVIDEIVDTLGIPEELKEELASLSVCVKSDNEDKTEKVEPKENSNAKISHFSTEDAVNVRDVAQDEKAKVDVSSIIKRFTDNDQPKQSDSITKDNAGQYGHKGVAKCPPAEPNDKQIPKERQLYSTVLIEDKSNQERPKMNVVSSQKSLQLNSSSEVEQQDMEGNEPIMHSEESIPENELTHYEQSGLTEEGQNMSSAIKDLEQLVSCKQSVSSSESGEQHSSEEEPEVEREETQQESKGSDDLFSPESHSEEEEEKQLSSSYYEEVNATGDERTSSPDSQHKALSEDEEPEAECQAGSIGPNVSVDESTCNSDVDEPSSEKEEPHVECKKLKVIVEESSSDNVEEEEDHLDDFSDHREQRTTCRELKAVIEETEENEVSSDEDHHKTQICDKTNLRNLTENQYSYTKKDNSSLIKSGFNADEDSGNDHDSCEEHVEEDQPNVDEQINGSNKAELGYNVKESSSEEERAIMDRYLEEICTEYEEASALATQFKDTKGEKAVERLKHQFEEIISQSVTERVILLEKQVADAQKTTKGSTIRRSSQRNAPLESDIEDSPSESQAAPVNRSVPQSSLSFSYDSSGVITTEPESKRVKSIREMFLAKSAADIQHGQGRFPSLKRSDLSELRADTSTSAGYQTLTSSELSSEDDSARKSITKGFVRRTIERLYGKKEAKPDEEVSDRPPSPPKQKKKEHSSIFSPFQMVRSKAVSELSYFNSSNPLDNISEATRCAAFNAQVMPEDAIDNEQWLLRENILMRKSVSDPVGIDKNLPQGEVMCKDTEEKSTKSELEDKKTPFSRKCTYFSLPHASDSDACQEELHDDSIIGTKDNSEDTKMREERNSTLPGVGVTDFKMKDNKVHPLVEPPLDGEVVVLQPRKGQGAMSRRVQDPDMLDILYDFCGQHCPIL